MRIDTSETVYHEAPTAREEFDRRELKHLRWILRRLRFLEVQAKRHENSLDGESVMAEREIEALAWLLSDVGYLIERAEVEKS